MKEVILKILYAIRPDIDFRSEKRLLTDEVLDSFDIVSFLAELDEKLGIEVDISEVIEDNFDSIERICHYLERKNGK